MSEAATIAAIYRYPVKGLSAEPLARVALAPGECLPHDRRFAVALATTSFDPERPEWLSKTHCVMLMRDEKLAELSTSFDAPAGELTIEHAARARCRGPAAGRRGAGARLCRCPQEAQCDDRPIRLADQPRQHRRARGGRCGPGRPAALPRQCLSRSGAGLERARLGRLRDRAGRRAAPGDCRDHPVRGNRGQPGDGRARPRYRRRPAARLWAQFDGRLCRDRRGRRHRDRRRVEAASGSGAHRLTACRPPAETLFLRTAWTISAYLGHQGI